MTGADRIVGFDFDGDYDSQDTAVLDEMGYSPFLPLLGHNFYHCEQGLLQLRIGPRTDAQRRKQRLLTCAAFSGGAGATSDVPSQPRRAFGKFL